MLDEERRARILDALRAGQTPLEVARELRHDPRTVRLVARESGIALRTRHVQVPAEDQRHAAHLLQHTRVSIPELARSLGISRETLKRRMHALGVRGYGRHLRPSERARIEELLAGGLASPEVARRVGRSIRTVERIAALRGVPARARARA